MDEGPSSRMGIGRAKRLVQHVEQLVARGQVTQSEADRLRSTEDEETLEEVVGDIGARHLGPTLAQRVADGSLSQAEADGLLERVRRGEHARALVEAVHGRRQGTGALQAQAGSGRGGQEDVST